MKKISILPLTFVLFSLSFSSNAQFSFERSNHINLLFAGNPLSMPWAGGLNYAQFSEIDMDFDGRMDLFVFDRSDDQIRVFLSKNINGNDVYVEAPQYRNAFPSDLQYRAALVDYNYDGLPDIFTYGIGGLKVYRNVGNETVGHQWVLEEAILRSMQGAVNAILYVSSADIPAIVDVDGDGDMDILTFNIGGNRVEYHKNLSMEQFGIPDSLKFELRNECWGNFLESDTDNTITLNANVFPCGSGGSSVPNPEFVLSDEEVYALEADRDERHAGSTLLVMDYNNSGVMDLILGDIAYPNLVKLQNGGTAPNTNSSMVSVDYFFPGNSTPASVALFPTAFWVDADHDGIKDLVVTPNAKIVSENMNSVWRYKNTGTNELPNFVYQETNFLQNQMIDVGSGSIPILVDVNGDGLTDLLVANFFSYKPVLDKESRVAYYRNTGTAENPVFTFVTYNQFNLNSFGLGLRIVPTFGDIDGDGDLDMIVGDETGRVHLFTNSAGTGNTMAFTSQTFNLQDEDGAIIDVGTFSAPTLVDIDRDGLLDLVIGNKNGLLFYYRNNGTAANPSFVLTNSFFGNINVAPNSPDGYAVPHFVDLDGNWHLFLGARDGKMYYATGIEDNVNPGQEFDIYVNELAAFNIKAYSAFAIGDLNNNGRLELFAGSDLGGIELFEHDPNSNISVPEESWENQILVYPNPTENTVYIMNLPENARITVLNAVGQTLVSEQVTASQIQLNLDDYQRGIYFLVIEADGVVKTVKVIKS
jgi:hypothetical protein